jgi:hypothetical protein
MEMHGATVKVIWYLMCYFQMKVSRDAGCYSFVVLVQKRTTVIGQINLFKRDGTLCPLAQISDSSCLIPCTAPEIPTSILTFFAVK